ncbi:MAG: hypothetical protein FD166_2937 [Bacteroidetes bacterium]|nr:MAG: hypothetical protein FD166_2937 [Bacteroidota bacterium]
MKLLLVSIAISLSLTCYSQSDSLKFVRLYNNVAYNTHEAGLELQRFSNSAQLGISFSMLGSGCMAYGAFRNDETTETFLYIGGASALAGMILFINSYSHTRFAGYYLGNIKPLPDKLGVSIPIK